jgi:hypothetical protein
MKTTLVAAAYAGYLMFGLFQIVAAAMGIQHLTGMWWLVCWFGALLIGWIPLVGTAFGIYGAYGAWKWSLPVATALFVSIPTVLLLLLTASVRSSGATERDTALAAAVSNEQQG